MHHINDRAATWRYLPHMLVCAFLLRAVFALTTETIQQSDEIYQYLEQAHRVVYGAGVIPWEFRFGLRSWIVPGLLTGLLHGLQAIGLDEPTLYIPAIKIIFCALSVTLVLSVYIIARKLMSEDVARLAAVFVAVWYELVYMAHKSCIDTLSAYAWFGALAVLLGAPTLLRQISFGLLAGIAVAIRIQNGPLVAVLLLFALFHWPWRKILPAVGSFALVIVATGWVDDLTWGGWFGSFIRYFHFNWSIGADNFFGKSSFYFYPATLLATSLFLSAPGFLGLLLAGRRAAILVAAAIVTVGVYSLVGHKEHRFIFATIPLWLMGLAFITIYIARNLPSILRRLPVNIWPSKIAPVLAPVVCAALLIVSVAGAAGLLPLQNRAYGRYYEGQLSIVPPLSRSDILVAYLALSKAPDVGAVYDEARPWWSTGGFYYLHKDVPLYYPYLLNEGRFPGNNPVPYVTHWIRLEAHGSPGPDYVSWQKIGDVEVWRRRADITETRIVPEYSHHTRDALDDLLISKGMRTW